jgi:aspartokinase
MGSSLSNPETRRYFIDVHLKRYVSEGTELVVVVHEDNETDALVLHVNVIRKDGRMIQLSSELTLDPSNWPRPSNELIAQLMMVG